MDIIRFLLFKLSCGHWESHTYKYICITILHQINRNKVILWIVLNYNSSNACTQNGTKLQWWCSKGIPIAVSLLGMFFFFAFSNQCILFLGKGYTFDGHAFQRLCLFSCLLGMVYFLLWGKLVVRVKFEKKISC